MKINDRKTRLLLHLSGRWETRIDRELLDSDILYRSPDIKSSSKHLWRLLPRAPKNGIMEMRERYSCQVAKVIEEVGLVAPLCLVNDHFMYGVLAVAGQLEAVSEIADKYSVDEIVVYSTDNQIRDIPSSGIANIESGNGSKHVIGAAVAGILLNQYSMHEVKFQKLNGNIFLSNWVRRTFMRLASFLLILRITVVLLLHRRVALGNDTNSLDGLVFVRSLEHGRHAKRLFKHIANAAVLLTPQFLKSNTNAIMAELRAEGIAVVLPERLAVVSAFFRCFRRKSTISNSGSSLCALKVSNYQINVDLKQLELDYNALPIYEFQRLVLAKSISKYKNISYTLGFEIQGPIAFFEGDEPRKMGVKTRAIQTVLVQDRPLPVFPFVDEFFADSRPNLEILGGVGGLKLGSVLFSGPSYSMAELPTTLNIKTIGFFTQPYETDETVKIVRQLCESAKALGFVVNVRLHPRDSGDELDDIFMNNIGVCQKANPEDLKEFLRSIDVCVTRTSSVSKEALAIGCPVLNVLLSDIDRSVTADFLPSKDSDCLVYSLQDLDLALSSPENLLKSSKSLRDALFAGKGNADFYNRVAKL